MIKIYVYVTVGSGDLIVTTSYTETEGSQDTIRILRESQDLELISLCSRNSYRSLRPQRTLINEEREPLMYKNNYQTLFKAKKSSA